MRRYALLLMALLLLSGTAFARNWSYDDANNPELVRIATESVRTLGPGLGAHGFAAKTNKIEGFNQGMNGSRGTFEAKVESLQKSLTDLGAQKTDYGYHISLSADVLFDFDKWNIKREAEKPLQDLATILGAIKVKQVVVSGHTDGKGTDAYNDRLGQKRAEAVVVWLKTVGKLPQLAYQASSYGKRKPVAPNTKPNGADDPEGRAKNRRVEINVEEQK